MRADDSPTPDEIAAAPALAVLAMLDHALVVTQRALLAAHPEVADPDEPGPGEPTPTPMLLTAVPLLEQAQGLRAAIARYCLAAALRPR